MAKLTALSVKNASPGRHADGHGLYLLVKPTGARSWLLRVQVDGHRRDIGLGSTNSLTLAEAREKAAALRKVARNGGDPVAERDRERKAIPTFKAATKACHEELKRGWVPKHAASWLSSLEEHAWPALGNLRVDSIEAGTIRDALAPIWIDIPVMARKVRQRIGMVLNFANAKGWRTTETPGRSVTLGLSRQPKGGNFAAMPHMAVPAFMEQLRDEAETVGRMALMFTILTAARSGEVRGATWREIDEKAKSWTVPPTRMKARREHVVPLTEPALAVLEQARKLSDGKPDQLVFPGKGGKALSDMTLTKALRDAGVPYTVHGFRSAFRDWAAERTSFPGEIAEAALAHAVPNRVEAAYRRTDFFDKRRKLMTAWANYLAGGSNVIRLAAG